jgi:predicted amidohydrolase YtcJ
MFLLDKTYYNGKIYTMNEPNETVSAIVVHDGRIVYAGDDAEALAYPVREKEDLGGRVGLPGICDTHIHLLSDCMSKEYVALNKARSVDEIVETLRARDNGEDGWLIGADVTMSDLAENRYPLRRELDRVSRTRSVLILSHCLHVTMVNGKALALAGVTKDGVAGDGRLTFYDDGEPDGIMREEAYTAYLAPIFETRARDPRFRKDMIEKYIGSYSEQGYTTLHSISNFPNTAPGEYFDQYYELEREGALPVRVVVNSAYFPETLCAQTGFGTDMVKVGAKKIFLDGSLGGRTAAMIEPYTDAPVDPPLPFLGMECAVTRKSVAGFPTGGLVPEEALSVYDAVRMYTRNAAFCSSEEHLKGTISPGKYADFILIDRDIFEIEPTEIHNIKALKTVVGGKTRWER